MYIGAPQFSARKAAGNSAEEIERLADYAHLFGARVHVALNTLLFDNEVERAKEIAWRVYEAGADVLIVQDMALMGEGMPPIELHASTQCVNRTAEKVLFWQSVGLRQVVLARELSLKEIEEIAKRTTVRLETFVHGALCVSYSGQCFMSYCAGGRSANRGECAQPCRLPYRLLDNKGNVLEKERYLLSLKDNNQSGNLGRLLDAGVSSFKIEGRLKDATYVSNITLYYRRLLDGLLRERGGLRRLSVGETVASFDADPHKSFNRGFSDYFARGRREGIWQPGTPKSVGEPIGTVASASDRRVEIEGGAALHNGDGLCFFRHGVDLIGGSTVNSVSGKNVVLQSKIALRKGDKVFRNHDIEFDKAVARSQTRRTIGAKMTVELSGPTEMTLTIEDEEGVLSKSTATVQPGEARNQEAAMAQMERQMTKTGQTHLRIEDVGIAPSARGVFVTASELNAVRRDAIARHEETRRSLHRPTPVVREEAASAQYVKAKLLRQDNVLNNAARSFYERHGAETAEWGYERQPDNEGQLVMTTRHCILFSTGRCLKKAPSGASAMPLELVGANGSFRVETDCKECIMKIYRG